MKQTSVEWLFEKLWDTPKDKFEWFAAFEQAKEMEKRQITQSFVGGSDFKEMTRNDNKSAISYADQYYRNNYREKTVKARTDGSI